MKKRWPQYLGLGLTLYLFFLLVTVPAEWLAWGIGKVSHGSVRLDQTSGSLWLGSGKLVVFYPQTTPHDLGDAEWGINPFWLITGRIQIQLESVAPQAQINGKLRVGLGSVTVKGVEIIQPAHRAATFYPAAKLINPQGQLKLTAESLSLNSDGIEGSASLIWQAAASGLSNVRPLGDYRLEFTGEGKFAKLKLTTERGALALAGQGQWKLQSGQLQFNGTATPKTRKQELESLLNILGKDRGNGMRSLVLNLRIPYPLLSGS